MRTTEVLVKLNKCFQKTIFSLFWKFLYIFSATYCTLHFVRSSKCVLICFVHNEECCCLW